MDNLYFSNIYKQKLTKQVVNSIAKISFEQSTNTIIILSKQSNIHILTFNSKTNSTIHRKSYGPVEELQNRMILLLVYLVESESILIITNTGEILTLKQDNGYIDIKAQNDQGIIGATISPMQQYIYIATKNQTILQLNMEFDLVKQISIDDQQQQQEKQSTEEVRFTWRADGKFMCINFDTQNGRKCLIRDTMLTIIKSPAESDKDSKGLVQSVSEKGNKRLQKWTAWQPMGGIISGVDKIVQNDKNTTRIIFWQKNGLRHLEFNLNQQIKQILQIEWIICRPYQHHQILVIQGIDKDNYRQLYFYYRSNYHWYLKNKLTLSSNDQYIFIQGNRSTKLMLFRQNTQRYIEIIELKMESGQKQWRTCQIQQKNLPSLFYNIDGNKIYLTDFNKNVIPPPMCQITLTVDSVVRGVVKMNNQPYLLIILQKSIKIYNIVSNEYISNISIHFEQGYSWNCFVLTDVEFIRYHPIELTIGNQIYTVNENNEIFIGKNIKKFNKSPKNYQIKTEENQILQFTANLINNTLTLYHQGNQTILSQQCTSFIIYKQFIIYTTFSSGMYQKIFLFNLQLDQWIYSNQEDIKIKQKIQDIQKKGLLNYRSIERGGIILCCNKDRVIIQLPRGNLQTFSPKILIINSAKHLINIKKYKQSFQIIRTHKLDLNLLCDINLDKFILQCQDIIKSINKTDYINLFISQLKQQLTSQLDYCYSKNILNNILNNFQINYKGYKIQKICSQVSKTLRSINSQKYILSIFTSQIKMNKLEDVLFQIKQMKSQQKQEDQELIPPHITQDKPIKKNKNNQQILEYVCWLVDADVIYEASLLTYDLELASMTARCTQKDPKQYIPYLESLKLIKQPLQLKKKICLDLKRYQKAIEELATGNQEHIQEALQLIQKHKLFKCGLLSFSKHKNYKTIKEVKVLIIDYLLEKSEFNEAYNMCLSIQQYNRALEIGIQQMDCKKILNSFKYIDNPPKMNEIIQKVKETTKNKSDLAMLYIAINDYNEAARVYFRAGDYKGAYDCIHKISQEFSQTQFLQGFKLGYSLIRNQLIKQRTLFLEKYNRLQIVQKSKKNLGNFDYNKPRESQDMYSQVSVSSKSGSQYTISTTTGMRRKKDKKRNILSRNVKQGSPLEEQYLLAYLADLKTKADDNIRQAKMLIQTLIYLTMIEEATLLRNQTKTYAQTLFNKNIQPSWQIKFQEQHPQAKEIYSTSLSTDKSSWNIDSFDYLL